jgi:hypothetical protein
LDFDALDFDFVAVGLVFVAPGLDFVAVGLDFQEPAELAASASTRASSEPLL